MAYLNSDDMLLSGSLHYGANFFAAHPDIDVVYGHRIVINEIDQEVGRWVLPPHDDEILAWVDYVPQETLFWRRSIWNKAGGHMDESFQFALDWDLILRFRTAGAHFARLPRFLGAFRVHASQKTSARIEDVGRGEMNRLRERYLGHTVSKSEIGLHIKPFKRKQARYHKLYCLGLLRF